MSKCVKYNLLRVLIIINIMISPHHHALMANDKSPAQEFDTILIGSEPDYSPFCFVNEKGEAEGFAVDLFKAACKAVDISVQIEIGMWDHIRRDLANGNIDALPFVGKNKEREAYFDFTMSYLTLHGGAFVRKGVENEYQSFEDVKNKHIIVMKGDNAEEYIHREGITNQVHTAPTYEEAFKMLSRGEYDVIIVQHIVGLNILKELKIRNVVPLDYLVPSFDQKFCFAVTEGNNSLLASLEEGLSIVIANDTYSDIYKKWLGPSMEPGLSPAQVFRKILIILIPIIVLLTIFWIVLLRQQVRRRTAAIETEVEKHKKTAEILRSKQVQLAAKEAQVRLLMNSTAEGIIGMDTKGRCTIINKAAVQILRLKSKNEILNQDLHNLIHHSNNEGEKISQHACKIRKSYIEGNKVHADDEVFWRADKTSFPVEYFSYPIIRGDHVIGGVITFWDITQRKETENELNEYRENLQEKVNEQTLELNEKVKKLDKSQKAMLSMVEDLNEVTSELKNQKEKLESANAELEAFTYSVSHDLRAPLRAINGFAKFITEDYAEKLDSEGNRFLNVIQENAKKMDRLITDLLNLSRVTRCQINYSDVDMKAIANSIYHEVVSNNDKNSFEFVVKDLPKVQADPGLIKQVWQNLIDNAIKYSRNSEIRRIEISARPEDGNITFSIRDYGAGFNEKYVNKLFGAFQRLHRDDEFKGTGIGLALSKRIIQKHGGKIWGESPNPSGATFYFSLPNNSPNN